MSIAIDISHLAPAWQALEAVCPISKIHDEAHYDKMVELMHAVLDTVGENEAHPLAHFLYVIGNLIGDYDDEHYPAKEVASSDMLRFLMQQHGLKQSDLPEIGSQGVVSEILAGKRDLNMRHIRALAKRFNLSPSVFAIK